MQEEIYPTTKSIDGLVFVEREIGVECPHCRKMLNVAYIRSMKVAGCQACSGMLVQSAELSELITVMRADYRGPDVIPPPVDNQSGNPRRFCPSCAADFETHSYCGPGNVMIDSCIHCRMVWLDGGELTRIMQAPGRRCDS